MTHDDGTFDFFGPEYVRPPNPDCPDCSCCTAALCERGRVSVRECAGHVDDEHRSVVTGCPCSSESARGSLAWRVLRIRAVTAATEEPLPVPLEVALRGVEHGTRIAQLRGGDSVVGHLVARGMVDADAEGSTRLTEYGRLYLAARTESRQSTAVLVHDVNVRARTARVVVVGRTTGRVLTVPMDQLANEHTGLTPEELSGAVLNAYANCSATHDDDVVLTRVSNPRRPATQFGAGEFMAGAWAARDDQAPDGDR